MCSADRHLPPLSYPLLSWTSGHMIAFPLSRIFGLGIIAVWPFIHRRLLPLLFHHHHASRLLSQGAATIIRSTPVGTVSLLYLHSRLVSYAPFRPKNVFYPRQSLCMKLPKHHHLQTYLLLPWYHAASLRKWYPSSGVPFLPHFPCFFFYRFLRRSTTMVN